MTGRPASDDLRERIRKVWAANREDTDFTYAICAARMGTSVGVVARALGKPPQRKREPSSDRAVLKRRREGRG